MKAIWKGATIAESNDTVVVEGNHYFPMSTVNMEYLKPSETTTVCPWKGVASYYSINVDGELNMSVITIIDVVMFTLFEGLVDSTRRLQGSRGSRQWCF
jgi:hypothetical protein